MATAIPTSVPVLESLLARLGATDPAAPVTAAVVATPIGALVAAATDEGLCLLEFGDEARLAPQLAALARHFGPARAGDHPLLDRIRLELGEYFEGRRTRFELPLAVRGTPFQEAVWWALLEIPYGRTTAYADLAESLGRPGAQRAVGLANGQNRLAIVVPCHRVIERGGGLRGYGGGLWRKKFLLDLERRTVGLDGLAGTPLGDSA